MEFNEFYKVIACPEDMNFIATGFDRKEEEEDDEEEMDMGDDSEREFEDYGEELQTSLEAEM